MFLLTIQSKLHAGVWLIQGHLDVCFCKTNCLLNTTFKIERLFHLWVSSVSLKPRPQPILQKAAELHCLSMQRKIVLLKVTNYWMYSPFNWFLKCTFYICYGWNRPYSPSWSWTCRFPNLTSWNYRCVSMSGAWIAFYQEKHFPLKKIYRDWRGGSSENGSCHSSLETSVRSPGCTWSKERTDPSMLSSDLHMCVVYTCPHVLTCALLLSLPINNWQFYRR